MESVALPGGGGVKAAIKGYRIAIKTGTAKKVGPDGRYINKYIAYTAGVAPASQPRFALVVVINDPQAGNTWRRRFRAGLWCHHGRRIAYHEHRAGCADNGR